MTKKQQSTPPSIADILKAVKSHGEALPELKVKQAISQMEYNAGIKVSNQRFFEQILELQTTSRCPLKPAWLEGKTFTLRVDEKHPTMIFLELLTYDSASDMNDWDDYSTKQTIPMTITEFRVLVNWFSDFKEDLE